MALSGVRSSWLMVARKRDLARLASSALSRASSDTDFDCSSSAISASFSARNSSMATHGRVEPVGQPDEIDVDADRHRRHRPVERVIEQREADDDGDGHRQRAGIDDRQHGRGEQHAHRDDDEQRGEDEGVRRLALGVRADEGDAGPGHAVEELGGGDLGAPHRRLGIVARRSDELPAQRDQDALGHEHGAEPDQEIARRRPEHGAHGDDDGEEGGGDGGGQLVPHEHQQELVLELRLAARLISELFAGLLHAAGRAALATRSCRSGSLGPR